MRLSDVLKTEENFIVFWNNYLNKIIIDLTEQKQNEPFVQSMSNRSVAFLYYTFVIQVKFQLIYENIYFNAKKQPIGFVSYYSQNQDIGNWENIGKFAFDDRGNILDYADTGFKKSPDHMDDTTVINRHRDILDVYLTSKFSIKELRPDDLKIETI